ncbi:hypothetical protein [uncultured Secundilactobacillus sp.]|uniref:hypothetical protein n=1 Tax=uncultured Secundilactobacillus sp. TaxID=2813935 RepID=UPI002582DC3A|nr:hypothetical protein [uncultured Secundilactobacillus sp.]
MKTKQHQFKFQMILCVFSYVLTISSILVRYVSIDWSAVTGGVAIIIGVIWWLQPNHRDTYAYLMIAASAFGVYFLGMLSSTPIEELRRPLSAFGMLIFAVLMSLLLYQVNELDK